MKRAGVLDYGCNFFASLYYGIFGLGSLALVRDRLLVEAARFYLEDFMLKEVGGC